jgi:hypothetical protein
MRAVAEALEAVFIGVECVCSDEEAHRGRLRGRSRGIPGWPATVSWEHVNRMRALWEPWQEPHLVVDSAVETPASALAAVLESVLASRGTPGPGTRAAATCSAAESEIIG